MIRGWGLTLIGSCNREGRGIVSGTQNCSRRGVRKGRDAGQMDHHVSTLFQALPHLLSRVKCFFPSAFRSPHEHPSQHGLYHCGFLGCITFLLIRCKFRESRDFVCTGHLLSTHHVHSSPSSPRCPSGLYH